MASLKTIVVALGGNAIIGPTDSGDIHQQFANTRASLEGMVDIIADGHRLVITHGNGPQVGNYLIRVEAAGEVVPVLPLGVIVADIEGGMGYMIEQCLQNVMWRRGITRDIICMITQVIVDKDDPSLADPAKYVGPFYDAERAAEMMRTHDWVMKEDSGRGWRRVVPSPAPQRILAKRVIRTLLEQNVVVIAGGGGGIPAYFERENWLEGLDAVVDKDLTSAVLGNDIGADELLIITGVDRVALRYGKPEQHFLERLSVAEAEKYLAQGEFPAGSMGPKIRAAINFIRGGGKRVVITSIENSVAAVKGEAGTIIE